MNVLFLLAAIVLFLFAFSGAFYTLLFVSELLKQPFQLVEMIVLAVLLPGGLGLLCVRAGRAKKD